MVMLWVRKSESPGLKARLYHLLYDHGQVNESLKASVSPVGKTRITGILFWKAAARIQECLHAMKHSTQHHEELLLMWNPPHKCSPLIDSLSIY